MHIAKQAMASWKSSESKSFAFKPNTNITQLGLVYAISEM
jgi:hypothetical protein